MQYLFWGIIETYLHKGPTFTNKAKCSNLCIAEKCSRLIVRMLPRTCQVCAFKKQSCNVMFFRKDMFSPTWPCSCILAGPTRNVHSCICFSTSYPNLQRQLNMIVINCLVLVANHRSGLNCLVLVLPHAKKFFIWPGQNNFRCTLSNDELLFAFLFKSLLEMHPCFVRECMCLPPSL